MKLETVRHVQGLKVGSAATRLGVCKGTLRRWHREDILAPHEIDPHTHYRYYSLKQIEDFQYLRCIMSSPVRRSAGNRFTFADLFSGIGGFRLAFNAVGGKCVFSSEIDPFARKTYSANFGETPSGDITGIPSSAIPPHDVLLAGFPCQPFSRAGVSKYKGLGRVHGFEDTKRGQAFFEITRILNDLHPPAFVLENVKNLLTHGQRKTWQMVESSLTELGYHLHYKVLNASLVVPQSRERLFIVGFLDPIPFHWPEINQRQVMLDDLLLDHVDAKYTLSDTLWHYLQDYSIRHRRKGNGFGYSLADPKGISRTLSARYYKDGAEILVPQSDKNPRRLVPRECARLMGFPDQFEMPVSDLQAYRQFGNAVVVPLVHRVAEAVANSLEGAELRSSTACKQTHA